jgi:hypothetical protein
MFCGSLLFLPAMFSAAIEELVKKQGRTKRDPTKLPGLTWRRIKVF